MAPAAAKVFAGDLESGKAKAATCAACHGADGNAMVPMYPKLAGQHEKYLVKQLVDFKKGADTQGKEGRADPVMAGMVAALSEDDMKNIAAFFASQKVSPSTAKANDVGKNLYFSGDAARGITACVGCHSADGGGMGQAGFPTVAAQNVDYLKAQLTKFRSSTRANDLNGMMRNIASKLSDEEIQAVAEYMSSIK
ncbi:MAG: c-type cytochrome [Thalassotalea sp.]